MNDVKEVRLWVGTIGRAIPVLGLFLVKQPRAQVCIDQICRRISLPKNDPHSAPSKADRHILAAL